MTQKKPFELLKWVLGRSRLRVLRSVSVSVLGLLCAGSAVRQSASGRAWCSVLCSGAGLLTGGVHSGPGCFWWCLSLGNYGLLSGLGASGALPAGWLVDVLRFCAGSLLVRSVSVAVAGEGLCSARGTFWSRHARL
jgi:hypothetical protein